jgi:hypothetical protein
MRDFNPLPPPWAARAPSTHAGVKPHDAYSEALEQTLNRRDRRARPTSLKQMIGGLGHELQNLFHI